MECAIVPIGLEHVEGFNAAVGEVGRERKYISWVDAPPIETSQNFVAENIRNRWPQFVALDNDKVVGWCDITQSKGRMSSHCGMLGVGVIASYRGKGIGKELIIKTLAAAKDKGFLRIELVVLESNVRAIELYKKIGFVMEGVKQKASFIDGKYENDVFMGLLF